MANLTNLKPKYSGKQTKNFTEWIIEGFFFISWREGISTYFVRTSGVTISSQLFILIVLHLDLNATMLLYLALSSPHFLKTCELCYTQPKRTTHKCMCVSFFRMFVCAYSVLLYLWRVCVCVFVCAWVFGCKSYLAISVYQPQENFIAEKNNYIFNHW